jgi:hypothetical protein
MRGNSKLRAHSLGNALRKQTEPNRFADYGVREDAQ